MLLGSTQQGPNFSRLVEGRGIASGLVHELEGWVASRQTFLAELKSVLPPYAGTKIVSKGYGVITVLSIDQQISALPKRHQLIGISTRAIYQQRP